jgi:hypothetical protein
MAAIGLDEFGAALAGLTALSTAAFGLLDATKAFGGGISKVGLRHIRTALRDFERTLAAGVGAKQWWEVISANWMNGTPKAEQKAAARALLKLGLSPDTADELARGSNVDAEALRAVARKLAEGAELTDTDLNLLGRVNAILDAVLDSAFERADQQYRNASRVWAGAIAIGLAVLAQAIWNAEAPGAAPSLWVAIGVGLVAVPIAPVAKDLTSGLSSAMRALKAVRGT